MRVKTYLPGLVFLATLVAVGYILEEPGCSVVFSGDTAQTERLWQLANQLTNLKAVFIETSFPNRMQGIADVSGHYTPRTLREELPKLAHAVPKFVYHIKPRFYEEVVGELKSMHIPDLHIVEQGLTYEFT